jgi:hypothetical protein
MAYSSKRSQKPKNSIGRIFFWSFQTLFFALPSSFLLAKISWNSDQVTTWIGSTMMESKSRKTKECMAVVIAGLVVAVVMAETAVAVVIAKSVVAVVMVVTITRNSKDLDVKPALDMMMQTRIQQSKY